MRVQIIFILFLTVSLCRGQRGFLYANRANLGGFARVSLFDNDRHTLSGVGNLNFDAEKLRFSSGGVGLAYDNARGFGVSLTNTHVSKLGDQLTAATRLSVLQTDNHIISANAFVANNMPLKRDEFQAIGGGVVYMFKNKLGASISVARTPHHQMTEYSVGGNVNLFREGHTSIGLDVGACKIQSPFMKSDWELDVKLEMKTSF